MRLTQNPTRSLWALCIYLLVWGSMCGSVLSQVMHPYRTPESIALTSQLLAASPFSNTQLKMPVSDWLQTTLLRDQIPIWIDRRIPSDVELDVGIPKDQTNRDVLQTVAALIHAEIAYVDRYIVLVPEHLASAIEWSYWTLCTDPSHPSLRAVRKDVFEWSDGSDTREIWKSFVERYRLGPLEKSSGLVDDFDRWRAGRLESTSLAAISTLLLCGFDQRLEWSSDGQPSIQRLAGDFQQRLEVEHGGFVRFRYATEIPKIGKNLWQAWRTRWPEAVVQRVTDNGPGKSEAWDISAPVSAHRELIEPLAPPARPKSISPGSTKKYTGRYRGESLKILDSLAQQLGLQLDVPDLSADQARREVDVSFQDATLDELLAKLGQAAGMKIVRQGQSLNVRPLER